MSKERILIVEDEEDIQELLQYNLSREGYQITSATTGEEALELVRRNRPDLMLLDIMLPGVDGLEICRQLRVDPATKWLPVIMLSAKGEESDIVVGLELGADDYVAKPFSPQILKARIRAVLRRRVHESVDENEVLARGSLLIDPLRHRAELSGESLDLTATEFGVLLFMARHPGWVFTRQQIVDAVKGTDYAVTERSVDVQMVGLRRKLGDAGDLVETVRGVGYRFKDS